MNYLIHQKRHNRVIIEFKERASKPVHIYSMKEVFIDIKDTLTFND